MFANSSSRVSNHTEPHINKRIEQQWKERVAVLSRSDKSALIDRRLAELDKEWDVERVLQTNFSALSLLGIGLASTVNKRWSALAIGVPAFMIQHALQGWCPPLAILRRLGVRTAKEINDERFALQALRGDFALVRSSSDTTAAHEAVKDSGRPDLQ
jgi:hypothetical protein